MQEDKFKDGLDKQARQRALEAHGKGSGFGGEFVRLPAIYREKLSKPMPDGSIKQHPSKTYLSTIKAIFVTERLNDVFGIGGWDFESEIIDVRELDGGKIVVVAAGRIYLREFDLYSPIQYGGHDGKVSEMGDIYKSAITDCQGKCASLFEIGIQVFKGVPNSKEKNVSKRLDPKPAPPAEPIENPQGMEKPSYEPIEDEPAPEVTDMEKLRERHVELFGKKANANISLKKLKMKIAEEEEKLAKEEEETFSNQEPPADPIQPNTDFEPVNEEPPANDPKDFEPIDEEPIEVEEITALDVAKAKTDEFVDADALKESANSLVFDAQMDGCSPVDIAELKDYIKASYKELRNVG